jgi:hypothetical protein
MADKPTAKDVKTSEELDEVLKAVERDAQAASVAMSQMASALKGSAQATDYQARAMRSLIKGQTDQIAVIQQQIAANQGNKDAIEGLTERLRGATEQLDEYTDKLEAQNTVNRAATAGWNNLSGALGVNADATQNFIFQLAAMGAKMASGNEKLFTMQNALGAAGAAANTFANFIEQGFIVLLKKGWDIAVGLNEAQSEFAQRIGASTAELRSFKTSMESVTFANLRAGVTAKQTGEAFSTLYTSVSEFSRMSAQAQSTMAETVTLLMQGGTSAQDAAQGMQMLNKVLGQSGSTMAQTVRGLDSFARALNVPPAIVQRDFSEMSMDLSVYGGKMVDTFKKLQVAAKNTGLSMNQLMSITGQFDTFEGAAEAAGRLNAILGRDLFNSLDMLLTVDPTERFRKLREGIMQAAGSFEELSYYEKRAIADAAGLQGVGELALLMSGHLERGSHAMQENAMSAQQMAERQMALMSLQQKWNATLQALAPNLMEIMDSLLRMVNVISQNIDRYKSMAAAALKVWGALKVMGAVLPMIQTGLMAYTAATGAAATATGALSASLLGGAAGIGLVAVLGALASGLFKPKHSPSLYDGLAALAPRIRRTAPAAREAAEGFKTLAAAAAPVGGAIANSLGALTRFGNVDTRNMNNIASSIRNIASAVNEVDTKKSLEFRASVNTMASQQVNQVVNAAVQLSRDDVQKVSDLVEQANKLSVASRVSQGDNLNALVRSVAQIAATSGGGGGGGGGGGYAGPQNVEVTLKMAGSTLARQVVPIVNSELKKQLNQNR